MTFLTRTERFGGSAFQKTCLRAFLFSCYSAALPDIFFVVRIKGCVMKAVYGQIVAMVCLMSIFSGILSGCTVGGKSFSIDSNSRVPFFGLELNERKPKSSLPSYRSISQKNRDTSDVKITLQVGSATPKSGQRKRDNRFFATSLTDRQYFHSTLPKNVVNVPTVPKEAPISSIPLPRTDMEKPQIDQRTKSSDIDFQ